MKTKILEVAAIDLQISKINPPMLVITASGHVSSGGWQGGELSPHIYIAPPAGGIYGFDFVATPPTGIATDEIKPITAQFSWPAFPNDLNGVRIFAKLNTLEEKLAGDNTFKFASQGGGSGNPRGLSIASETAAQNITLNASVVPDKNGKSLIVHGSIITYREDDVVEVTRATPQGFNPMILLLRLKIKEGSGPMKGTPKAFSYQEPYGDHRKVSLIYGPGALATVDVQDHSQ